MSIRESSVVNRDVIDNYTVYHDYWERHTRERDTHTKYEEA